MTFTSMMECSGAAAAQSRTSRSAPMSSRRATAESRSSAPLCWEVLYEGDFSLAKTRIAASSGSAHMYEVAVRQWWCRSATEGRLRACHLHPSVCADFWPSSLCVGQVHFAALESLFLDATGLCLALGCDLTAHPSHTSRTAEQGSLLVCEPACIAVVPVPGSSARAPNSSTPWRSLVAPLRPTQRS